MKKMLGLNLVLLLLAFPALTQPFTDVSDQFSFNNGYGNGPFGGGVSFCDFNDDGWDDLTFCTQKDVGMRFFRNNEGTFQEILPPIDNKDETKQVLWVDYDNDGDKDLYVTANNAPNRLYQNDGNFQFEDITIAAGFGLPHRYTFGAAFGDYDNDGWLDLYVVNRELELYSNFLYRNQGDGTFQEVSTISGALDDTKPSFCASFFDVNGNGFQDIYIAQDRYFHANTLFKNEGDGTFEDISMSSGSDLSIDAMNVGIGDYDNDGDFDIYVTNTAAGNKLLRNEGNETFTEVADLMGVALYEVSWGGSFFDYDNDGWLDLYVSTDQDTVSNPLYRNINGNQFEKVLEHHDDFGQSYSNAIGDFNRDGLPDLVVNNAFGTPFRLWKNESGASGNYIQVELEGIESNRDGIGSTIEVYAGDQKWVQYTYCGIAYLAQNSDVCHVGIGEVELIDSIKVRWLSGVVDHLDSVEVNQKISLLENSTNLPPLNVEDKNRSYFQLQNHFIKDDQLNINISSDKSRPIQLQLFDVRGAMLYNENFTLSPGINNFSTGLPQLASGIYLMHLGNKHQIITVKLQIP